MSSPTRGCPIAALGGLGTCLARHDCIFFRLTICLSSVVCFLLSWLSGCVGFSLWSPAAGSCVADVPITAVGARRRRFRPGGVRPGDFAEQEGCAGGGHPQEAHGDDRAPAVRHHRGLLQRTSRNGSFCTTYAPVSCLNGSHELIFLSARLAWGLSPAHSWSWKRKVLLGWTQETVSSLDGQNKTCSPV